MTLEPLLLVKRLLLGHGRPFLGTGDFASMSTVTTSLERPLTEPELAELGKQRARLLQDIGELVMQKEVAADEFRVAIGEKQKQVEEISRRINLGLERQDIECHVLTQHAREGTKEFRCRGHGQIVRSKK